MTHLRLDATCSDGTIWEFLYTLADEPLIETEMMNLFRWGVSQSIPDTPSVHSGKLFKVDDDGKETMLQTWSRWGPPFHVIPPPKPPSQEEIDRRMAEDYLMRTLAMDRRRSWEMAYHESFPRDRSGRISEAMMRSMEREMQRAYYIRPQGVVRPSLDYRPQIIPEIRAPAPTPRETYTQRKPR